MELGGVRFPAAHLSLSNTKTCLRCGQTKPVAEFHLHRREPDGLHGECKECRCARQRAAYVGFDHAVKPCAECGKEFIPYRRTSRFCSLACQRRSRYAPDRIKRHDRRRSLRCVNCGIELEASRSSRKYCSRKCLHAYRGAGYALERKYGITLEQRDARLQSQNGCAICHTWHPDARGWVIDHDHACCPSGAKTCGKCIRGVLCFTCNLILGYAQDEPNRLQAAIAYLEA